MVELLISVGSNVSDNIDDWDESKLSEVAEKKHGEHDRKRPNQTDIVSFCVCNEPNNFFHLYEFCFSFQVCKYFLEAVENSKYGWFWECPNGDGCIYRHALPSGYLLKKDKKKLEEHKQLNEISLEELLEKEVLYLKFWECKISCYSCLIFTLNISACTAEVRKSYESDAGNIYLLEEEEITRAEKENCRRREREKEKY